MSTGEGLDDVVVRQVGDDHFVVAVGGAVVGRTEFRDRAEGVRVFTHTVVEPAFGGRGLASILIRTALDETRAAGLTVRPLCPYVRAFMEQHPEFADLQVGPLET